MDIMRILDLRRDLRRHSRHTVVFLICSSLVWLFYHSAQMHRGRHDSLVMKDAAIACSQMQGVPGMYSGAPKRQPKWWNHANKGYSSAMTIMLDEASSNHSKIPDGGGLTTTVVAGHLKNRAEDVAWINKHLHNVTNTAIYIVDDPESQGLHLQRNHGRESIVYLRYIIDHFDALSDVTFFWHPARFTWHNNLLLKEDSALIINRMSRELVMRRGYVNSRCESWPGCPGWVTLNPSEAEHALDEHRLQDKFTPTLFRKLFPDRLDYPRYLGQACCSQFAVSREAILRVGLAQFERLYEWIDGMNSDWNSGRMMEMLWQYVFLERGTVCLPTEQCYCETYDVCYGNDPDMIRMMERWNDYRARTDGLNEQIIAAEGKLRDKLRFLHAMAKDSDQAAPRTAADEEAEFKANAVDDPELVKLHEDYAFVRKRGRELKAEVMRKWGIERSSEWF